MKILTKYTLREFLPPFFLALLCFTSILLLDEIFRLTKLFVSKGIGLHYLVRLLIYVLPATMVVTIPMATLVGILLSLGRLSTDNEITAMRSHGVGFHQILLPLLVATAFLSVFDFFFMDYALPRGNVAYAGLKRDISMRNPSFILEEGIVMKELEREGKLWMFESTHPVTKRLQNVKVWDSIWDGRPRFIRAQEAKIEFESGQAWLNLYNGITYEPTSGETEAFRVTAFQEQRIALDFTETVERREYETRNPRSMTLSRLKIHIQDLITHARRQEKEKDSFTTRQILYAQVEYHKKFSIPFACLTFGLIGVPLGLMVKRSGRMVGFGIGLGLILIYYLLLQLGQDTGRNGTLPTGLAIWMPNIVIGLLGLGLNARGIWEGKIRARHAGNHKPPFALKTEPQQVGDSD